MEKKSCFFKPLKFGGTQLLNIITSLWAATETSPRFILPFQRPWSPTFHARFRGQPMIWGKPSSHTDPLTVLLLRPDVSVQLPAVLLPLRALLSETSSQYDRGWLPEVQPCSDACNGEYPGEKAVMYDTQWTILRFSVYSQLCTHYHNQFQTFPKSKNEMWDPSAVIPHSRSNLHSPNTSTNALSISMV